MPGRTVYIQDVFNQCETGELKHGAISDKSRLNQILSRTGCLRILGCTGWSIMRNFLNRAGSAWRRRFEVISKIVGKGEGHNLSTHTSTLKTRENWTLKPQPFALHCNECRWSKRYAPRSDLIWEGMIPEKCQGVDLPIWEKGVVTCGRQAGGYVGSGLKSSGERGWWPMKF